MRFDYRGSIPTQFADDSRVWVYQSNRPFTAREALEVEQRLYAFTSTWLSHGVPVKGFGRLCFNQFLLLMADQTATGVSGCSTDGSVRLMKQIEQDLGVQLFDRQLLAFIHQDQVRVVSLSELSDENKSGWVNPDSMYFDNTVQTKSELVEKWITPVKQSWLTNQIIRFRQGSKAEVAHPVERQLPKL
jgi:hypothetical protein